MQNHITFLFYSKHLNGFLYTPLKIELLFSIGGYQKYKKMFAMFAVYFKLLIFKHLKSKHFILYNYFFYINIFFIFVTVVWKLLENIINAILS